MVFSFQFSVFSFSVPSSERRRENDSREGTELKTEN